MKIKIRYDNHIAELDIPSEEFSDMIRRDYEDRLSRAADPASVQRRSPQKILDDRLNKPDYNNWHRHYRHWDGDAVPSTVYGGRQRVSASLESSGEKHHFSMDEFPDLAALEQRKTEELDESFLSWIRKNFHLYG